MRIHAAFILVIATLAVSAPLGAQDKSSSTAHAKSSQPREKVLGLGGLFVKAKDPKVLATWYEQHLGVTQTPTEYDKQPWTQEAGPTVFAPFSQKTTYFDRPEQQWMINFRVRNLDAMVAQLRNAGIDVKVDPETYPNGRFARLHDPEGNPIELWEPKRG